MSDYRFDGGRGRKDAPAQLWMNNIFTHVLICAYTWVMPPVTGIIIKLMFNFPESPSCYWKWNFPRNPHVRLSVGLSVCHNSQFHFPCSCWSTCSYLNWLVKVTFENDNYQLNIPIILYWLFKRIANKSRERGRQSSQARPEDLQSIVTPQIRCGALEI